MSEKKTTELLDILNNTNDESKLEEYLNSTISNFDGFNFVKYFEDIIKEKNFKKSELIEKADLDRTYAYQILKGSKKPSRDKVIQLCIGGSLDLDQTQRALRLANVGELYAKNNRDAIIIFAINKGFDLITTNGLLDKLESSPLGDELK